MNINWRRCVLALGGLFGMLSVVAGALGSHWLEGSLSSDSLQSFMIASRYGLVHAVLLVGLSLSPSTEEMPTVIPGLFCVGVFLFSGSIFMLSLFGGPAWMGPITPVGGVSLIIGWMTLIGWAFVDEWSPSA